MIVINEDTIGALALLILGKEKQYGRMTRREREVVYQANLTAQVIKAMDGQLPMRAMEITEKAAPDCNCQKIVPILGSLVAVGAMKRIENPNEFEMIEVGDNLYKKVPIVRFCLV